MPQVSILIPCYNAEAFIDKAIQSALQQKEDTDAEIIVIDDGSTDQSWPIIQRYRNHIHCETGPNRGGNAARNRLLDLAQAQWLQYLDADDYLLPGKISTQLAELQTMPQVDILYGPSTFAYPETNTHQHTQQNWRHQLHPLPTHYDAWQLLFTWHLPQTGSPLWRKQAIIHAGRWDESFPCCQEHDLYERLLASGANFQYTNSGGSVYRQWSQQTVSKSKLHRVHERQKTIRDRGEAHLRKTKQLTPPRLQALCQGHFETARAIYNYNPTGAIQLMKEVQQKLPNFQPQGPAATKPFKLIYNTLGYAAAEKAAALARKKQLK